MVAYKAVQPNEEFHTGAIPSLTMAFGEEAAVKYMTKYGFDHDTNSWAQHQSLLDMFKEIDEDNFLNMVLVGIKVAEMAPLPPNLTIPEALSSLEMAYQSSHRNVGKEICRFVLTGERSGDYTSVAPYPTDFEYGMVYGLVKKYCPKPSAFRVVPDEVVKRNDTDSDTFILHIEW